MLKLNLFGAIISAFILHTATDKVTDKQYVSMPELFHFDDFDRCMLHEEKSFYCVIVLQLHPLNNKNTSKIWNIINKISSDHKNYRHDILRHGICIPEAFGYKFSHNKDEIRHKLEKFYNVKYKEIGIWGQITKIRCETKNSPYTIDIYDILFAVFILTYIAFVLFASIYEGNARYKTKEEYNKIKETIAGICLFPFSLPRNWYRLKDIKLDNSDIRALRSIQGIRFYNMVLVITGHTITMNLAIPVSNPIYTETMHEKFSYPFLGMGKHIIQTYLLISGWLLTYHFFLALEKEKKFKPFYFILAIIHRYIRLTPSLVIMIAFHSTWLVHLSRGPFWDQLVGEEYRLCRKNWWANLLYLNNYINEKQMCFPQTWYVAVDTQLYILSLGLLWLMWNYRKKIVYILGSVLVLHVLVLFYVIWWNDWEPSLLFTPEVYYNRRIMELDQLHMTSFSPYSNLAGLVAGLGFGYLFYRYRNQKLFTKKIYVVTWWVAVWSLPLAAIFLSRYIPNHAVCGSLDKSVFVFGIGLGIFGVTQGIGWMMKWICEWPPTYILGRLTYSAYLVHIFFQRFQAGVKRSPNYLSDHIIFVESIGNVAVSYIGALLLTLFVEMPVSELQKRLIPKRKKYTIDNNKKNSTSKIT